MIPQATLLKAMSVFTVMVLKTTTHHSCHTKMVDPRQKPTADSDARIGVDTALIPIPYNLLVS